VKPRAGAPWTRGSADLAGAAWTRGPADLARAARTRGGGHAADFLQGSAVSCRFVRVSPRPTITRVCSGVRLVVGAGCSLGCPVEELAALVEEALAHVGGTVTAIATVDRRAHEPCIVELASGFAVPLRTYAAAALAEVTVPTPSAAVARHVGTPSVSEAAALLASGGELIVPKRRSPHATCAVAKEL
jgi:cobalt-precorrin 5A hydrolase